MKTESNPVTVVKKEYRTIHAISNVLVKPLYALQGELPPLGEVGHMDVYSDDVDYRLSFRRLPSGRLGKWKLIIIDYYLDGNPDTEPEYYAGYGQHGKWQSIDLDQYKTKQL